MGIKTTLLDTTLKQGRRTTRQPTREKTQIKEYVAQRLDRGRFSRACVSCLCFYVRKSRTLWKWPCLVRPCGVQGFFLKDSSVCLDGSWVFIYPHRGPWIERILHVQLCFSLVIDFWTHAIYVNAHMDLHLTAHACLLPSIIMFLYSLYDITKW